MELKDATIDNSPVVGDYIIYKKTSGNLLRRGLVSAFFSLFGYTAASAAGATSLKFYEDTDNGTNYAALQGPPTLAGNVTSTLPGVTGTLLSSVNDLSDLNDPVAAKANLGLGDAMIYKGVIDCSTNPDYPAADRGDTYKVSVAGKIGGASGINVEVGDTLICSTDATASGSQAGVGASWGIIQQNVDGNYFAGGTDVAVADGGTGTSK